MAIPLSHPTEAAGADPALVSPAPVVRELPADLDTPVSVYLKLAGLGPSFLLESVTGGEQLARYSFIGVDPSQAYVLRGGSLECHLLQEHKITRTICPDPLASLREELKGYQPAFIPGLPRFRGGLVGFLSYEMIRYFEPSVGVQPHDELPDGIFLLADTVVAFDHAFGKILLIANIRPDGKSEAEACLEAEARVDSIQERLARPVPSEVSRQMLSKSGEKRAAPVSNQLTSNVTREQFTAAVRQAKEFITAGDIFQVVLSQRLARQTSADSFSIYRALRRLNPSPYMFFFDFDGLVSEETFYLIGASPEMHVRLEGARAVVRPIAGTRPRGKTTAEDETFERDLLADPKERAEHVMLVDLARNDLGRVCEYGTVRVPEKMIIERYSHVMHIVSQVEGVLRPEFDAFDLVRATFPAGTVSGAPKIRAMQIIRALEGSSRGPYAGLVGYFGYDGSMDTCITIRTMTLRSNTVSVQAGAGIVADSDPESEYQETLNKARALAVAVEMAEKG